MNFLAHSQLAWPEDGLIAGALEGDYYKGPVGDDLPPDVAQGVRLHRAVDAYTDQHPRIKRLREEFPPGLRRCAGILIDLAFDHYLSTYWHRFSETALPEFIPAVYSSLQNQESVLSEGARSMLSRMIEYDILALYGDWHTVPATMPLHRVQTSSTIPRNGRWRSKKPWTRTWTQYSGRGRWAAKRSMSIGRTMSGYCS